MDARAQQASETAAPAAAPPAASDASAASAAEPGQPQAADQAATEQPALDPFFQDMKDQLDGFSQSLSTVAATVAEDTPGTDTLVRLQTEVDQVQAGLAKILSSISIRLTEVRAQLLELGTAPGPGETPEPAVTTEERNKLLAQRSEINALSDQAQKLSALAEKTSADISHLRRVQFTEMLFAHTDLVQLFSSDFSRLVRGEIAAFKVSYGGWLNYIWNAKRLQFLAALFLSLLAAVFSYRISSRLLDRTKLDLQEQEPDYVARLLASFWTTMIPSLALLAFLAVSYVLFVGLNIFLPDVERFVRAAYVSAAVVIFVFLLSRNVLTPGRPQWRLVPISNSAARNLTLAFTALAVINWADILFGVLNDTLDADLRLEVARSLITSVMIGTILIAVSFIRPRAPLGGATAQKRSIRTLFPSAIAVMTRLVGVFIVVAALIGYVALSRFAANQVVLTGGVLITMYIGILLGQAVSQPGSFARTGYGKHVVSRFGVSSVRSDQISLVLGLVTYAATFLIGIPMILISWGVRWEEIKLWAGNNLTSVTVGSITISLGGILIGILLFVAGYLGTRWFQGWFDNNVLLRSKADSGVRNSVKTGISYLGIVLAGLLAISAAGVNLSSLALVASALSIGIGFGLQTIVSNFVSGLILLAERPFKVGDWIVSGTTEGFVKRISVRATEIETFQRQSIIVPNSELINASVGNWMHHNQMGRSEVAVGVSYDSDPRTVMNILMEIGTTHPLVLQNPEPMVIFVGFGESTLDFELRVYLADVFNGITVRNDIRVAIFERFRDEGITIPYPQRDLHIIPQKERHDELANSIRKQMRKTATAPVETTETTAPSYDHPDAGNDDSGER
ncbi:MAG: mechanosensitive ion channel domain-containing protein [Martelella sp.]|uniref:mechanosensitive ion channel family protein n=1 Tax=Martelella sp. TaxID=1969699 RepID=UPI003241E8DC